MRSVDSGGRASAGARPARAKCRTFSTRCASAIRLAINVVERPLALRFRREAAEPQRLEEKANLRERRAQLVRHARHEVGAQACELVLAPELDDGDDRERRGHDEHAEQERQVGSAEVRRSRTDWHTRAGWRSAREPTEMLARTAASPHIGCRASRGDSNSGSDLGPTTACRGGPRCSAEHDSVRQEVARGRTRRLKDVARRLRPELDAVDHRVAVHGRHERVGDHAPCRRIAATRAPRSSARRRARDGCAVVSESTSHSGRTAGATSSQASASGIAARGATRSVSAPKANPKYTEGGKYSGHRFGVQKRVRNARRGCYSRPQRSSASGIGP